MSKLPPLPRKYKNRSYPIGPGVFWWRIWKEEYHDNGGEMGYASWIDANRDLARKRRKKGGE
jgi:hypothetical protein